MLNNFQEIEASLACGEGMRTVALAGAEDEIALAAVVRAKHANVANAVLIGDEEIIAARLEVLGEAPSNWRIIATKSEMQAARTAVKLVLDGEADFPMKGLVQSATYQMAIKFGGLVDEDGFINEFTVFHFADQDRLIVCGDCAVNIAPSLNEKARITRNLIGVARALGASPVRVAALSVVEKPDPSVPSSMDADALSNMDWDADVALEGSLALDNILGAEAARHKGIESDVAGRADVIVVPDIAAGNVLHKCAHFFGHYPFASGLVGACVPVVMNSRTDDEDAKYYSILMACLQADAAKEA